jgi:hypothetical protein
MRMSEYRLGDYNRAGYIAFMFCMAFTMTFFIYLSFFHPGVDLKEIKMPETLKEKAVEPAPAEAPAAPAQ